ncbi:MAG: ATP-binding protein [Verrucomicrobiota bacterium]
MKSIRNQLLVWLLGIVAVFLVVAGGCVFFTVRYVLFDGVEGELQQARKVVYNLYREGELAPGAFTRRDGGTNRRLRFRDEERWRQFDIEGGELLYQLREKEGDILLRSVSLGDRSIERPSDLPISRKSIDLTLDDGSRLRARVDYANPEGQTEIIVARDITSISQTLTLVMGSIWGAGILAAVTIAGLTIVALKRGLAPLDELGQAATEVDAESLSTRFGREDLPSELLPICERLNGLMARLEGSFDRERRFSADLAHELRTPIAELTSMAEAAILLPDKVPDDQFEKMLTSARNMQRIVESLLDLARWEQGTSQVELKEVDVIQAVEECWEPSSQLAEEKALTVTFAISPGQILKTNPSLFRTILSNLFSNAARYAPSGGQVTIETIAREDESPAGLAVTNSVEGIKDEDLEHLFDRFWQHDPSRAEDGHSGLGLSVARACAETLSLKLDASLDEGSLTFNLIA